MMTIVEQDHLTESDEARLLAPLDHHAADHGFTFAPNSIILTLRSDGPDGAVAGGLVGATNWGWLHIRYLAVPSDHRGQGIGRTLMYRAEEAARQRGCRAAWVDTYSFQAPGFYERLDYRLFGELPDYPPGQKRLFYWKPLVA